MTEQNPKNQSKPDVSFSSRIAFLELITQAWSPLDDLSWLIVPENTNNNDICDRTTQN